MKLIFEEYGDLIVMIIAAVAIMVFIFDLISSGGTLHELFVKLAESAC